MRLFKSFLKPLGYVPRYDNWDKEISNIPDPDYVVIPLEYPGRILYHPLVKVGDQVSKNQIVGRSKLSHCVHTSISGIVRDIMPVWTAKMYHALSILIERNDNPPQEIPEIFEQYGVPFDAATSDDKLKALGVISTWTRPGQFDQEVDVEFPEIKKIVIRGMYDEPNIFISDLILQYYTEKIKNGLMHVSNMSPRAEIILVVSGNLEDWANEQFGKMVTVKSVSSDYKDRIENLMINRVTGIYIPTNMAYRSHGVAVISCEVLLNLIDALDGVSPFIHKFLTISGTNIDKPFVVKFPLGTTIRHILKSLNISEEKYKQVIVGGPMRGISQYSFLTPLTKTSHGLFLMEESELPSENNFTCTNCGRCTQVCPVNLQVQLIGRYAEYNMIPQAKSLHIEACMECGLCGYVCPAHRPLVQLIQMCKKESEISDEQSQVQAQCIIQSPLERWELTRKNPATVDDSVASGSSN